MNLPEVINIKVANLRTLGFESFEEWLAQPTSIYIGRRVAYVKGTFNSQWANPFTLKEYERGEALGLYENYLRETLEDLPSTKLEVLNMEGKQLGCWCHPEECHGDIIVKVFEELKASKERLLKKTKKAKLKPPKKKVSFSLGLVSEP